MKNFKIFLILTLVAFTIEAQDLAMNSSNRYNEKIAHMNTDYSINSMLAKNEYTYKYKGEKVLVIFSENEHTEYFNNKKYFIKSKIEWKSINDCFMTIKESNLPNFPFKPGTKLHMKILKIKKGYVYYESTLGGRSWTGKMKKIN
ncbi:hypothetical protein [Polaribacter sp. Z022]|uniref:hypothetical protein n=1 Tax=Polaribacter sp. Z022 TaxID=2927125 RepID=UPI0020219061|nr:hypothetical protein [Polaribacter sp. Z022]MCL7754433.1 hypothetical protein [Polaribacter sp. Z022]